MVDRGFIDGVMISMLVSSAVDRGLIDGVMVSNHYTIDEPTIYGTRDEHTNHYTIDEPTIYGTRDEHTNHYTIHRWCNG
jgi:hypothetical protein